jgi:uncharacterized protein (TIGR02118 family)
MMYKVMAFLTRKPGMTRDEFRDYYENKHAPLIGQLTPKMAAYKRNYVNLNGAFKRDEDLITFDVITEMEFEDQAACERWFEAFQVPDVFAQISADENNFLDRSRMLVCTVDREQTK